MLLKGLSLIHNFSFILFLVVKLLILILNLKYLFNLTKSITLNQFAYKFSGENMFNKQLIKTMRRFGWAVSDEQGRKDLVFMTYEIRGSTNPNDVNANIKANKALIINDIYSGPDNILNRKEIAAAVDDQEDEGFLNYQLRNRLITIRRLAEIPHSQEDWNRYTTRMGNVWSAINFRNVRGREAEEDEEDEEFRPPARRRQPPPPPPQTDQRLVREDPNVAEAQYENYIRQQRGNRMARIENVEDAKIDEEEEKKEAEPVPVPVPTITQRSLMNILQRFNTLRERVNLFSLDGATPVFNANDPHLQERQELLNDVEFNLAAQPTNVQFIVEREFATFLLNATKKDLAQQPWEVLNKFSFFLSDASNNDQTATPPEWFMEAPVDPTQGIDWYEIYVFFGIANEELNHYKPAGHFGRTHTYKDWVSSVEQMIRTNQNRFEPKVVGNIDQSKDFLLRRISAQQASWAIDKTIARFKNGSFLSEEAIRNSLLSFQFEQVEGPMFVPGFEEPQIGYIYNKARFWNYLITLFIAMRFVWSYSLYPTSLLLRLPNYGYFAETNSLNARVTQAFPFLICEEPDINFPNVVTESNFTIKSTWTLECLRYFALNFNPVKVSISVLIKRLYNRDKADYDRRNYREFSNQDAPPLDEKWFTVYLNVFKWPIEEFMLQAENIDYDNNNPQDVADLEQFRIDAYLQMKISDLEGTAIAWRNITADQWLLKILKNMVDPLNAENFKQWLSRMIMEEVLVEETKYADEYIYNDQRQADFDYILYHTFNVLVKVAQNQSIRQTTNIPKFWENIRYMVLGKNYNPNNKLAKIQKYEPLLPGCCLFESLWFALNSEQMKPGGPLWKKDCRKLAILKDFASFPDKNFRVSCIAGMFVPWRQWVTRCWPNIKIIIWEDIDKDTEIKNEFKYIVVCESHAVYCDNQLLKECLLKKDVKNTTESKIDFTSKTPNQIFRLRKLFPYKPKKKKYHAEVGYDIEAFIENGEFIPYCICTWSEDPAYCKTFWGIEYCAEDFCRWLTSLVEGETPHHGKKKKICFWGFNSSRFDLPLLLKHLVHIPGFNPVGQMTNIKGLKIKNLHFFDFLKLFPQGGSLKKQCKFWSLPNNKRKTEMKHNVVTRRWLGERSTRHTDLIESYCIKDCECLMAIVERFKLWVETNLQCSPYQTSLAGLAMAFYRTKYLGNRFITGCDAKAYEPNKRAYFGGTVEVYIRSFPHLNPITEIDEQGHVQVVEFGNFIDNLQDEPQPCVNGIELCTESEVEDGYQTDEEIYEPYDHDKADAKDKELEDLKTAELEEKKKRYAESIKDQPEKPFIYGLDINSAYPNIMKNYAMPIQQLTGQVPFVPVIELSPSFNEANLDDHTLYTCIGIKWKKEQLHPTIACRTPIGLQYTSYAGDCNLWGIELKLALSTKNIESGVITHHMQFKWANIFKRYIEDLYEQRLDAKRRKDKVSDQLIKLIMNALYGKFGQRKYPKTKIVPRSQLQFYVDQDRESNKIMYIEHLGNDVFEIAFAPDEEHTNDLSHMLAVSSWITAMQRVNLRKAQMEIIKKGGNIYYCDTDSIYTDTLLPPEYMDDNELGKWKIEKKIHEAVFISPKVYLTIDENGEETFKFKGIKQDKLEKGFYQRLLKGQTVKINTGLIWFRSWKRGVGQVTARLVEKNCNPVRKRDFDIYGFSKPL